MVDASTGTPGGILPLSLKREGNPVFCNTRGEPRGARCRVKKKPDAEGHVLPGPTDTRRREESEEQRAGWGWSGAGGTGGEGGALRWARRAPSRELRYDVPGHADTGLDA